MATRITGVDGVMRRLRAISREVDGRMLADAGEYAMESVRDDAARLAPRRTGKLSREMMIEAEVTDPRNSATVRVGPSEDAWYGIFPEIGTIHQPPQPYLRPALDQNDRKVLKRLAARLWRDVKRAR